MKNPLNAASILFVALAFASLGTLNSAGQDAKITGNARVDHLLGQMTLDEKIAMIHGTGEDASTYQGQAGYMPGIERLGIPPMRFADGPPGVLTRVPSIAPTSTMGLAATFSREDARLNGAVIGREARSHGITVALQPFINIDRDLNYGRGYNTFGEDPFLTGEMGAAEVTGIQGEDVMSQAKHYVAYDTDATNVFMDDQTLHEVYVAPFAAVSKVGVSSIMCSYNKINGPYSCGNPDTLNKILKDEVGFEGFVTSDWGATHATDFINAGLDMEMSGPLRYPWRALVFCIKGPSGRPPKPDTPGGAALSACRIAGRARQPGAGILPEPWPTIDLEAACGGGSVSEETMTRAAGRVLLQMDKFGYLDGKIKLEVTPSDNSEGQEDRGADGHRRGGAAEERGRRLPLKTADLANLAMIGPGAGQTVAVGLTGEKAVGLPELEVGPLAALKKLAGDDAHVTYAVADDMDGTTIPAKYLSHFGEPGLERRVWNEEAVSIDTGDNFTKAAGTAARQPKHRVERHADGPRKRQIPSSSSDLGCCGLLKIDDQVVARNWFNWIHGEVIQAGETNIFPTTDGLDNIRAAHGPQRGPAPHFCRNESRYLE